MGPGKLAKTLTKSQYTLSEIPYYTRIENIFKRALLNVNCSINQLEDIFIENIACFFSFLYGHLMGTCACSNLCLSIVPLGIMLFKEIYYMEESYYIEFFRL